LERLFELLEIQEEWVVDLVADALASVEGTHATDELILRLTDGRVSGNAFQVLLRLGPSYSIQRLLSLLEGDHQGLRRTVAEALGRLGDTRAVEPLIAQLSAEDPVLRRTVAEALGRLGDTRAVGPLITQLHAEKARDVLLAVVQTLGHFGSSEAIDALVGALENDSPDVRKAALGEVATNLFGGTPGLTLLSRDIDGRAPWLDPKEPIKQSHIQKAAKKLNISPEKIDESLSLINYRVGGRLSYG
jgi:HEAT repeat protein